MSIDYIHHLGLTKSLLDRYQEMHSTEFPGGSKIHYDDVLVATHKYLNENVHDKVQSRAELHDVGIYLTDHGPKHIELVLRRASQLVRTRESLDSEDSKASFYASSLNPYEIFILVLAVHFHDVGNMYGREGHEQRIREEMEKIGSLTIAWPEKTVISQIASCHGGKVKGSKDTIQTLPSGKIRDGDASYRPQLLAAVLRLADELADEKSRADNYGLIDPEQLPPTCLIFHKYAEGLKISLDPLGGRISLQFSLQEADLAAPYKKLEKNGKESDQYLIDEIYERTLKTYTEMIYCGRYMRPLDTHLHEVGVEILIYTDRRSPNPSGQLHYIIGDSDYPDNGGDPSDALKRLARDFGKMPNGTEIAKKISQHEPLPRL
jgi:hypothetical protein